MPKLPRISGKDAIPNKKTLAPGLLRSLISKAELTVDEFIDLL